MIRTEDIMLLCNQGLEMPELKNMIKSAQRKFVNERHTRKIYPLTSGPKMGRWKTYVYVDGKRKEIAGKTEDDVYESLYKHYSSLEERPKTLSDVFELLKDRKQNELARSEKTIREDVRLFNHLSESLRNKDLVEITESDIRRWIVKEYLPNEPREEALKKHLQLLRQIFDYGIHRKICFDNPVKFIIASDYANKCELQKKRDEERAFSKKELEFIRQDCMMHLKDPFALMTLASSYSGLRAGELPVLRKSDDLGDFLHVHRQQRKEKDENGHQFFYELPHTKDERLHPHNGRLVPITPELREILDHANNLPGKSEYTFHNKKGEPLLADSYEQNLRRRCNRLEISTSNNHAFRIAYNSKLIELGFSAAERALILGHEVQTNENIYSVTDKRQLFDIRNRLIGNNSSNSQKSTKRIARKKGPVSE